MKTTTTITIDPGVLELAKKNGLNISATVQEALENMLMITDIDKESVQKQINLIITTNKELIDEHKRKEQEMEQEINKIKTKFEAEFNLIDAKYVDGERKLEFLNDKMNKILLEEKKFDKKEFQECKKKFKEVCIQKEFLLTTLNLNTWKTIFWREAHINLGLPELNNLVLEFKKEVENK
jgi:hypothetical protein